MALRAGYWVGKNDKQVPKQIDVEYPGSVEDNRMDYGYVRDGKSVRDFT